MTDWHAPVWVDWRPIDTWPGPLTPESDRRHDPFTAHLHDTFVLLEHELAQLDATGVVVQIAIDPVDFRNDGRPRANARARHPGVIVAFESRYGPLKYHTDLFHDWRGNLRAISLSLEALRKVDRYGVSRRGEQYTGWKQLPVRAGEIATVDQARAFLDEHGGTYRHAARRLHPDIGGDPGLFQQLTQAKHVLEQAGLSA